MGDATEEECNGYREDLRIAREQEAGMLEKLKALDDRDLELLGEVEQKEHWRNERAAAVEGYDHRIEVLSAEIQATQIEISRTPEADSWRLRDRLHTLQEEHQTTVNVLRLSAVERMREYEAQIRDIREKRATLTDNVERNKGHLLDIRSKASAAETNLTFRCPGR